MNNSESVDLDIDFDLEETPTDAIEPAAIRGRFKILERAAEMEIEDIIGELPSTWQLTYLDSHRLAVLSQCYAKWGRDEMPLPLREVYDEMLILTSEKKGTQLKALKRAGGKLTFNTLSGRRAVV